MAKASPSEVLKEFGLTDDQILELVLIESLKIAVDKLKEYMSDKWNLDTVTAMKTLQKLREELL